MRKPLIPSAIARNIEIGKHSAAVLVIAMVFAACATAVYAAGPTRSFQLGLWSGGAYTKDQTGAFSHCGANVPYKSGITMFVVINRSYAWSLGFASPQWNLVPKAQIPIEIHFDGGQGFDVVGTVLTPILLEVPMPANSNLINTFRYALRMAATAQGQSFLFDLTNTSKLMVQLAACVQTSLALEFGQPPGTTAAPALPAVVASPSQEILLEETQLATNFLLAARLRSSRLLGRSEVPVQLASYGAVWKAEDAAGAVKIYLPKPGMTGLDLASEIINSDAQRCKGKFASARSSDLVDSDVVFRAMTSCSDSEHETGTQYFMAPRPKGGFVAFSVMTTTTSERSAVSSDQQVDLFKKAALTSVFKP